VARSSRRQYLPKVLHILYVGAQQQAAVRGVVLQQLRAAVLRSRRHVAVKGTREGGGGGGGGGTLSKNGVLKVR
jgi:hypothetical protein